MGVKEKEDGTRIYKKGHPYTISMGGEPRSARRGKHEKGEADLADRGTRQANHRTCVWAVVMYRRDGKGV